MIDAVQSWIKKSFFLLLLLFLGACALFPKEFFLQGVSWTAHWVCSRCLSAQLDFEDIQWKDGKVIFINGHLYKKNRWDTYFSRLEWKPLLNLKTGEIGGEIGFRGLKISHPKKKEKIQIQTVEFFKIPFFTQNFKIEAYDVEIALAEAHFFVDCTHFVIAERNFGWINLNWDQCPKLFGNYHFNNKESASLALSFQQESLSNLYSLFSYFVETPPVLKNWSKIQGKMEGNLEVSFLKDHPLVLEGALHFNLQGNVMGMEGEWVLDWQADDISMNVDLKGSASQLLAIVPEHFKKEFLKAFSEDQFAINAQVKKVREGLELEGIFTFEDKKNEKFPFEFGCFFAKNLPIDGPEKRTSAFSHLVKNFFDYVKGQFCLSQNQVGWFRASQVPVEKFLSPFLFREVRIEASGNVDIEATFDNQHVVLFYHGENLDIESPHFKVLIERIDREEGGVHCFDLKNGTQHGILPIKQASYEQKNHHLVFPQLSGIVNFENEKIEIEHIEAYWKNLVFQGEVLVNIHSIDDVDLNIRVKELEGPTSDAQVFLTHFTESLFWEIPLQRGNVKGCCDFSYHFSPVAHLLEGKIHGILGCSIQTPLFSLSDYQAHLDYDYAQNLVTIHDGRGNLHLPLQKTTSLLSTPSIVFREFPVFQSEFIAKIGEKTIEGKTFQTPEGRSISIKGENIAVEALQTSSQFSIPHFFWEGWEGGAFLEKGVRGYSLDELSCWKNERIGCTLSGFFDLEEKKLQGKVEKICWDLGEPFEKILSLWRPKGELKGEGSFHWNAQQGLKIHTDISFENLEFGGIYFGGGDHLQCSYSSHCGLSVEGLAVDLPTTRGIERYKLSKLSYDPLVQKIHFDEFDFSLPAERLSEIGKLAQTLFPGKMQASTWEGIEKLKCEESLEGCISLEIYPDNVWIKLNLKEGIYHISGKSLYLKDFLLVYDPLEMHIWSQCLIQNSYYWTHLSTDSMTMSRGKLVFCEREISLEFPESKDALLISWERMKDKGFFIQNMEGYFCGAHFQLEGNKNAQFLDLQGCIVCDPAKTAPLLPAMWKSILDRYDISGGFELEGSWRISKRHPAQVHFRGNLNIQDFTFNKIEFSTLSSQVEYQNNELTFKELTLKDWAGRLAIGSATFKKEISDYYFNIEDIQLEDLRISRIRSPWTKWSPRDKPFLRSLFVRNFELKKLEGKLGDLATLKGMGEMEFTNLPKKNLFMNLLFIPTEITARIGLDLTALVPVRGIIVYEIRDGKIFINEFKEMYSDGKRSRFYLADSSPAYIDFCGNLNFKVRMKQYNLLLKLAELFTITVKGTLFHPKYTLSNDEEAA